MTHETSGSGEAQDAQSQDHRPDTKTGSNHQKSNSDSATPSKPAAGVRSLTAADFDALESVGGVRGIVEAIAPGLVYLVLFVVTKDLTVALIGSLSLAVIMVVARLATRTPVTMAFSGIVGVGIGLFVAWRTGEAQNFYLWGILVNAAYGLGCLLSVLVKWPAVGVMVELLKSSLGSTDSAKEESVHAESEAAVLTESTEEPTEKPGTVQALFPMKWRKNPLLMRAYNTVTWIWVAMFAARLVVQLPLFLMGEGAVAALGAARLMMGVPLFALVLWISWLIIRQPALAEDPQE